MTGFLRSNIFLRQSELEGKYLEVICQKRPDVRLKGRVSSDPYHYYGDLNFSIEVLEIEGYVEGKRTLIKTGMSIDVKTDIDLAREILRDDGVMLRGSLAKHQSGIDHFTFSAYEVDVIRLSGLYSLRSHIRGCIKDSLRRGLAFREYNLANALLLGDRSGINKETLINFKASGIYHILAISGLHVSVLASIFLCVFRKAFKRALPTVLTIGFLLLYLFIVGNRPSITRSVIMFCAVLVQSAAKREHSRHYILSLSFCIILILFPKYFKDIGFWLSFLAVFAVYYVFPLVCRLLSVALPFPSLPVRNPFIRIAIATLSINVLIWPVLSHYFGYLQTLFLISNLLILPIFNILMLLLFLGALASLFWPVLGSVIFGWAFPFLWYIDSVSEMFGAIDISLAYVRLSETLMMSYYLFLGIVSFASAIILKKTRITSIIYRRYECASRRNRHKQD